MLKHYTAALLIATGLMTNAVAESEISEAAEKVTATAAQENPLEELQNTWAVIKYQDYNKNDQVKKLTSLAEKAAALVEKHPSTAELKIWNAIILSTRAGIDGGIGALKDVKKAKSLLEEAISQDPSALQGSAYTSLGALYYQVPGWPISFGDDEKAEEYLKKSLQINPDGIDGLYFYGEFLLDQKRYREADKILKKAQKSPKRPGRELADAGRQQEIASALSKVAEHK